MALPSRSSVIIVKMKTIFLALTIGFCFSGSAIAQMRVIYPENVKPVNAPLPTFPAESEDLIYGDEVRVLMDIDTQGKLKAAQVYGPLTPCANLSDPAVEAFRTAALSAARSATFEPVIEDGKPIEERISIGYRLRSGPLSGEERNIVSIGIANGRATSLPKPEYPEAARPSRLSGGVSIQVLINEKGEVISAGALSGNSLFSAPGVAAACKARFSPMTLRGQPAQMLGIIAYNFAP